MANWARKTPSGTSGRRKWNLEDRTSLDNLKYHFAANGCSDVQFDLARQLLESSSEIGESSYSQAVHWLLCAAHQGHEDALQMLNDCYKMRRGITDSNEIEVRTCLSMTPGERAARKAARELFACLSNGEEHITPAQLERRMREIYKLQKRKSGSCQSTHKDKQREKPDGPSFLSPSHIKIRQDLLHQDVITEANLISAAVNYSHGRLPHVNDILTLSIPHPKSLDHVPCFHRIIFHPLIFLNLLYHRFVRMISSLPGSLTSNLKFILMLILYTLFSTENIIIFLPMVAYYLSLIVMIWATFKMLKTKHDFIDFRIWSGLFLSYGDRIDADGSENQFLRNNLKPYPYFFFAFIANLVIYPVIGDEWLPHSEVTVISFFLVFITMTAFMYTSPRSFPDIFILFSFGINVLAKYPYEMDSVVTTGWRFLDLKVPTFCTFVIGNGIEFCLNCRAVLYLMIPGFLLHLARRSNWHGTYKYLIPHCVTLSWLQIFITSSQSATMFGLVRATLGLAGFLLFLPLFGIVTLMIPIFLTIEWLGLTDPKTRFLVSLTAAGIALITSYLMAINRRTQKYVTILQVSVCLVAASLLLLPYMTSNFQISHTKSSIFQSMTQRKPIIDISDEELETNTLSWDAFYNYCGYPSWEKLNKIGTQLRCSQLEGVEIRWEGTVSNIEIIKVNNFCSSFIQNYLPQWLGDILTCMYGEKNKLDCTENESCNDIKNVLNRQTKCNLNKWNEYDYEIQVRMHSGILSKPSELHILASNSFGNFTHNLNDSDRIWFRGKLSNTKKLWNGFKLGMRIGVGQPIIDLREIGCVSCHNKHLISYHVTDWEFRAVNARMRDLLRGVKYLLNVLFNPLLTFK